jgi:DNA-binding response OmpR family regulator/DnaJ-domain-containing protein 1
MAADRPKTDPPAPGPRTVLLVDDDREVQRFVTERFEREGWRVIGERDGDWALRAFERRHVDAVVLDILIPVVNGFQVAERIRAHPRGKDVGIVMLTGIYRGPRHRAEAIDKYKLLDYLDKPVEAERLVEILRAHFARLPASPPWLTPPPAARAPALVDERQRQEKKEVERAARAVDGELRGNLRRLAFPRLLAKLHAERRSGGLFLLRDKIKKIIYFNQGHPTFIKSNVLDECLGRVLVRERMITEQECEDSVRRMKKEGRQQGSVLIEMGVISPHNLRFGLELQLQVKLFEIFDWSEGEYVFREDVAAPAEVIGLDMSAAQIVTEGIRRHYHRDRLDAALRPHLEEYPELAADPERRFQDLDLTAAEQRLVHAMDGATRLDELFAALPSGLDAHGARALTLALLSMGVIGMRSRAVRARTVPPLPSIAEEMPESDTVPNARPDLSGAGAGGDSAFSDAELAALLADRRGKAPHEVLGLPPGAARDDVDRAYGQLARELHPDRFRGRPASTRAMAGEAFALATRAHAALAGLAAVAAVADDMTDPVTPSSDPAELALAADRLFHQGEARLRAREFADAERLFEACAQLRPDMGEYLAYRAWAGFCAAAQTRAAADVAVPMLRRAVELGPALEHPHLFLGLVWAALGEDDLAEPELEKAVQSNPDSAWALAELKRLHGRRGA